MASEHGTEVQAYLDKHKITKLFEDLLSKVVKELPASPVDFLISKLQVIKQKKKLVQPVVSGRSRLHVSGSSVSPRQKPSTSVPAKPSSLRSPGVKTSVSSTTSKLTPSRSPRPSSSSAIPKPSSRSTTRTPGSQVKPTSITPTRPTTAPSNKSTPKLSAASSLRTKLPAGSATSQLKSPAGTTKSVSAAPRSKAAAGTGSAKPKTRSPSTPKVKKPVSEPVKKLVEPAPKQVTVKDELPREVNEPSIEMPDEDDEELAGTGLREGEWSEEEEEEGDTGDSGDDFSLDDIIKLCKSSTHSKQTCIESLLAPPTGTEATPLSEGYWSEDGESGEEMVEGEVEMVEDYAALEEEGVIVTDLKKSKFAIRKAPLPEDQATVDLQLRICSRCARVMTEGDEVSATDTVSMVTQVTSGEADFESASQIGSHASFPQWTGSAVSSAQLQQSDVSEVSSDVTLQSHDTWGDIAPQPRAHLPPSDVESEVQLPPPSPLEGQPWPNADTPTQQDHYGWA